MRNIILIVFSLSLSLNAISQVGNNSYRIFLTDKNNNGYSISHPEEFLSQKAINRRINQDIEISENDLPLTNIYIDSLKSLGCQILNKSKWFNTVLIYTTNQGLIDTITNLGFVKSKQKSISNLKLNTYKSLCNLNKTSLLSNNDNTLNYGNATTQISMLNGHVLHQNGYMGQNMLIAVIDAGFYNADIYPAFDSLWTNNQIVGTKDFIDGDNSVFDASSHGMNVLSVMGGNIPGELVGTAPKANYWLLRTENEEYELAIEEDNWVAAAEFADSVGVDVINSSLGYTIFNNPEQSYTYSDLDGNTTFITKAADLAASKGLLVVISAGNEGDGLWEYISAPADGDSVLTVGAVDKYAAYADFSGRGPTSDGRIKPDVVALGYQTTVQGSMGSVTVSNGTSFSSPIIAGLAACLWQSLPNLNNMEIITKIRESAHQYSNPDNRLGYGLPDFGKASTLTNLNTLTPSEILLNIYPNPFKDHLTIIFLQNENSFAIVEIFDLLGKKLKSVTEKINGSTNQLVISELNNLPSGFYTIKINIGNRTISKKMCKL